MFSSVDMWHDLLIVLMQHKPYFSMLVPSSMKWVTTDYLASIIIYRLQIKPR